MSENSVNRPADRMRPVEIIVNPLDFAHGSAEIRVGRTRVLCAATVEERVPGFLVGRGQGWVTGEYSMLPASTPERNRREAAQGKQGGRTLEIQRLVGRSLRAVSAMERLGERTVTVDCDVLQADGGTRCASITGGYVALALALKKFAAQGVIPDDVLTDSVAAISVGLKAGQVVLDLDYALDSTAEVDSNFVVTGAGRLVEIQGTAERGTFDLVQFQAMAELALAGCRQLAEIQRAVLNREIGA